MLRHSAVALAAVACSGSRPVTDRPPLDVADAARAPRLDAAPPAPPDAPAGPSTFTLPVPAPTVTRMKAGKKPAQLRYQLTTPSTHVVDVAVDATVEVNVIGAPQQPPRQTIPKLTSTATAEVLRADTAGAQVRMTLDAAGPATHEAGAQLAELQGTILEHGLDPRGQQRDVTITSRAADQETAQTIATLEHTRLHTIVLPAEPVGIGGTWKVVVKDNVNGIATEVTTTYKLVARKGDQLTITGDMTATSPPQTLRRPEGVIEVKAMTGKGTIKATVDLHRAAPTMTFQQRYEATMQLDQQALKVTTTLTTTQGVRDKK